MSTSNYFSARDDTRRGTDKRLDEYDTISGTRATLVAGDDEHHRSQARVSGDISGRTSTAEIGITATQKMLAACSGSLLTSLLGM